MTEVAELGKYVGSSSESSSGSESVMISLDLGRRFLPDFFKVERPAEAFFSLAFLSRTAHASRLLMVVETVLRFYRTRPHTPSMPSRAPSWREVATRAGCCARQQGP